MSFLDAAFERADCGFVNAVLSTGDWFFFAVATRFLKFLITVRMADFWLALVSLRA